MKRTTMRALGAFGASAALVLSPMGAWAVEADTAQSGGTTPSSESPQSGTVPDPVVAPEPPARRVAVPAAPLAAAPLTVNLLAITDFHGHLSDSWDAAKKTGDPGAAALACQFGASSVGFDTTVRLSVGDNIGGSAYVSAIQDDEPTIQVLNAMGIQASATGNHEFDQGAAVLASRIKGEDGHTAPAFPYLAANFPAPGVLPSTVIHDAVTGLDIGVVGSVTDELPSLVGPVGIAGIPLTDPVSAINTTAKTLKASHQADIVVGLIHKDMAATAPGFSTDVDAVFGGHTHVTYTTGAPVPAVQAGNFGQDIGQIILSVDPTTKTVTSATESVVGPETIAACSTPDPTIATIVATAQATANEIGGKPAVEVGGSFYRGKAVLNVDPGTPAEARGVESTMGNLIADAARESSTKFLATKADIGVINAGGIRADLVPDSTGMLTKAQLFTAQPFGNTMGYVDLTGAQVVRMLEEQWQPEGSSRPMLKLGLSANVTYGFDTTADRLSHILWVDIDGKPIDLAATYTVVGNSFLLTGGDSFDVFKGAGMVDTGFIDLDALTSYMQERSDAGTPVSPSDLRDGAIGIDNAADLPDEFLPGRTYTLKLSSLSFTDPGASMATSSVSVCLGDGSATSTLASATVDNADVVDGVPVGLEDGIGKASVTFTLPADVPSDAVLSLCDFDNGFDSVSVPLAVVTGTDATPTPSASPSGSTVVVGDLAKTGADLQLLPLAGLLLGLGLAVSLVGASRRRD